MMFKKRKKKNIKKQLKWLLKKINKSYFLTTNLQVNITLMFVIQKKEGDRVVVIQGGHSKKGI